MIFGISIVSIMYKVSLKNRAFFHKASLFSIFLQTLMKHFTPVFRWTWTDTEELLKEKSFFILSFVFLSEFVIRQVQTNIY